MLFPLLIALLAVPASPPSAIRPATVAKSCPDLGPRIATVLRKNVRPQRLDQLPPGRLELTVMREVDGCPIPAVVREGIGR
jgi:hypothetical protein